MKRKKLKAYISFHLEQTLSVSHTWVLPVEVEPVKAVVPQHFENGLDEDRSLFRVGRHLGVLLRPLVPTPDGQADLELGVPPLQLGGQEEGPAPGRPPVPKVQPGVQRLDLAGSRVQASEGVDDVGAKA